MPKREREEARRRWLQEQKHRKRVKTELIRLKNQQISAEQIEKLAIPLPPSPLAEFFEGFVDLPDVDVGAVYRRELVDLVASDAPLNRETRAAIESELRRFHLPDKQRKQYDRAAKLRVEIRVMRWLKRHYEQYRGMAPGKAKEAAAATLRMTVDAWDKKLGRARREGIS